MKDKEMIEEMAKVMCLFCKEMTEENECGRGKECYEWRLKEASYYYEQGCRKLPENAVVLTREEWEKLKSLYDTQKGAIMTSSIGDLPLTVEGLRKAVDEIARLIKVQTELQELNIKYYNDAKDLRRENKTLRLTLKCLEEEARKETAEKFIVEMKASETLSSLLDAGWEVFYKMICNDMFEIAKQFGVEIKE